MQKAFRVLAAASMVLVFFLGLSRAGAFGADAPTLESLQGQLHDINKAHKVNIDTVWVLATAFLVFFMNLGFAMVESGLCRAKNCVNILAKNFIVFAISSIAFWVIGFGLMFGTGDYLVTNLKAILFVGGADNSPAYEGTDKVIEALVGKYSGDYAGIAWTTVPLWAKFFFQLVFAGTAATIVSGAVAERIKFGSFILFSFIIVGVLYPVAGHWIWGGGFLGAKGMKDFAGSTVVHSIGGWAALAGVLMLGPRIGKYGADGRVNPIPAHNMTSATLGCLVLWFGWFGFNPGSTMAADGAAIAHVAVTTNTAAAMATLTATLMSWWISGKPDLSMTLNGSLAGLVAITAPCAYVTIPASASIGAVAGIIVVLAVFFFDRIRVDDPVGALSVHLVNGVGGTLSIGFFGTETAASGAMPMKGILVAGGGPGLLAIQALGVVCVGAFVFVGSLVAWAIIKAVYGLRVSAEEELSGLDVGEHGLGAYHWSEESVTGRPAAVAASIASAPAGTPVPGASSAGGFFKAGSLGE